MRIQTAAPTLAEQARLIGEAAAEVGPALFFSLLIITLSFVPVFTLEAQEGKLFGPLAFTKTYSMAAAAGLSVTLIPGADVLLHPRADSGRAQQSAQSSPDCRCTGRCSISCCDIRRRRSASPALLILLTDRAR